MTGTVSPSARLAGARCRRLAGTQGASPHGTLPTAMFSGAPIWSTTGSGSGPGGAETRMARRAAASPMRARSSRPAAPSAPSISSTRAPAGLAGRPASRTAGRTLLGLFQPRRGSPAAGQRLGQRPTDGQIAVLAGVPAQAEQVGAGRHRTDRRLGQAVHPAHRAHLQRVGDITPVKPSSPRRWRSAPPRTAWRERPGQLGYPQVPGHHPVHPGRDGRGERDQVTAAQRVQARLDGDDAVMGVRAGAAVPGEVLGARGHPGRLQPADRGRGVPGHQVRVSRTSGSR